MVQQQDFIKIFTPIITFFILDPIWISYLAGDAYAEQINQIQGSPLKVRLVSFPIVYFLMAIAVVYYGLPKVNSLGLNKLGFEFFQYAMLYGGLLGLIIYGVFDLTNYALFDNWNLILALGDMIWGSILMGFTTYLVGRYL